MNHILEIVGMTFGVLGSAHIWKYFTERLKAKNEEKENNVQKANHKKDRQSKTKKGK